MDKTFPFVFKLADNVPKKIEVIFFIIRKIFPDHECYQIFFILDQQNNTINAICITMKCKNIFKRFTASDIFWINKG